MPGLLAPYLTALCLDVESTGYQLGHRHYGLRTIQLGGEGLAVVLDADDPEQLATAAALLKLATRLHAFAAPADVVPVAHAGLIGWDEAWAKMVDGVVLAKLTDPALAKSQSEGLKALSLGLLGDYSTSPGADKARAALFAGIKCLTETKVTTPVERSGWANVNKFSKTMITYAASDVLDLAAVVRVLSGNMPVSWDVVDRECQAGAIVAPAAYQGFPLDLHHIKGKIAEYTARQSMARHTVEQLTAGAITNPSSSKDQVLPYLLANGYVLKPDRKTKQPSAQKSSLEPYANRRNMLCKNIIEYRHCTTTLGLLLRPLENLCIEGDSVMRPTVYTLEAKTGRMSCARPNGQQFSRQGGIRACVIAGYLNLELNNGQWVVSMPELTEMRGISADFEGCEIRVAAALAGDVELYEAEAGVRCHRCGTDAVSARTAPAGRAKHTRELHWLTAHTAKGEAATRRTATTPSGARSPGCSAEGQARPGPGRHRGLRHGRTLRGVQPGSPCVHRVGPVAAGLLRAGHAVWRDFRPGRTGSRRSPAASG